MLNWNNSERDRMQQYSKATASEFIKPKNKSNIPTYTKIFLKVLRTKLLR